MNQQFILLVGRIWREFKALLEQLQEHVESIAEQSKPYERATEPQPTPVIRSEIQIPEKVIKQYEAGQKKTGRLQWGTFWLTLLTLITVGIAATFTYRTYREMQKQTDIARKAQRPWVGLAPGSISAKLYVPAILLGTMDEKRLVVEGMLENSGNSVALNVFSDFTPIWNSPPNELRHQQDKICGRINYWMVGLSKTPQTYGGGSAIFPRTKLPWERNKSNVEGPIPDNQPIFHVYLVGCIIYREPDGTLHQTRWCAQSPSINIPTSDDEIAKSISGGAKFTACPVGVGEYAN